MTGGSGPWAMHITVTVDPDGPALSAECDSLDLEAHLALIDLMGPLRLFCLVF